jgi:mono/diheme cytochrome c family protein
MHIKIINSTENSLKETIGKAKHLGMMVLYILFCVCSASGQDKLAASKTKGKALYESNCASCHMVNGEGIAGVFPPLAKSDNLEKRSQWIKAIVNGVDGPLVVNGTTYNGQMSGMPLSKEQVADIVNYISNTWGNEAEMITPETVAEVLKKK